MYLSHVHTEQTERETHRSSNTIAYRVTNSQRKAQNTDVNDSRVSRKQLQGGGCRYKTSFIGEKWFAEHFLYVTHVRDCF